MKLVYSDYGISMDFIEGKVNILCIEQPKAFAQMVGDFWNQINGEAGGWILSDNEKILQISKYVIGIYNPFSLDCNEKKVLTKIYSELDENTKLFFPTETAELNSRIVTLLDALVESVPYHLEMKTGLDMTAMFKLFDIRIESTQLCLVEHIIDYLRVMHDILHIDVFVFVNIKQYLLDDELDALYEFSIYEKIFLFLIEGRFIKSDKYCEKCWILDKDSCMIEI